MKRLSKLISIFTAIVLCFAFVTACSQPESAVVRIQISKNPDKMEYTVGELFDPTGMILVAQYADGTTGQVVDGYTWDITGPLEEDDDEIIITYRKRSILLEIDIGIKKASSLEVVNPEEVKTDYIAGDMFDPTGVKLRVTYSDESEVIITEGYKYSPKTMLTRNTDQIKFTYSGASVFLPITVGSATAKTLTVTAKEDQTIKTSYKEGELFDPSAMEVHVIFSDGEDRVVPDYDYSPKTPLTMADTKITVTYGGISGTLNITVEEVDLLLSVTQYPTKTNYMAGEDFDPAGMKVSLRESNVTRELASGDYTVENGTGLDIGSNVLVKYTPSEGDPVTAPVQVQIAKEIDIKADMLSATKAKYTPHHDQMSAGALNGDYAGNFEQGGTVTVTVGSASNGKAGITIKAASTWVEEYSKINYYWPIKTNSVVANKVFDVYVNDAKVNIPDSVLITGGETNDKGGDVMMFVQWTYVELANVDLVEGENTIQLRFLEQIYHNANIGNGSPGVWSSPVLDTVFISYGDCRQHVPDDVWHVEDEDHFHVCNYCKQHCDVTAHTHDQETKENRFLKAEANCIHKDTYSKSCVCGHIGTDTFIDEDSELTDHVWTNKIEADTTEHKHYKLCDVCDNQIGEVEGGGHTYGDPVVDATNHRHVLTCDCGYVQYDETAHSYGAPTLDTTNHKHVVTCSTCGKSYDDPSLHSYVYEASGGLHKYTCACGDMYTTSEHEYHVTGVVGPATAAGDNSAGTDLTYTLTCACGHTTTGTASQTDIKASHLAGTNLIPWATGDYASRTEAYLQNTGSDTVKKALNRSMGKDYACRLLGNSRIEVGITQTGAGAVTVAASSGWINNASWGNNTAKTGDMQFNLVFKAYIRHADRSVTEIDIPDTMIMHGHTGSYAIMAYYEYFTFDGLALTSGDTFVLESKCPRDDDGKYIYWDGQTRPYAVADHSVGSNETQSTPNVDTVTVFYY